MQVHSSHILIALLLHSTLCESFAAPVQTNQIAQLLATNRPGQYRLQPVWVGEYRTTIRTGHFATGTLPSNLRFDLFSFFDTPPTHFGSRAISQTLDQTKEGWRHTDLHIHRDSFPTDAEIAGASTVAALNNLLGPSQGLTDIWGDIDQRTMHSQAGWLYFRVKDDSTLETLSVSCSTTQTSGQADWYVDSIRIRRGTARPAR